MTVAGGDLLRLAGVAHRDGAAALWPRVDEGKSAEIPRRVSVLSLVNPKGYAAMAALFSGFVLLRERLDRSMRR